MELRCGSQPRAHVPYGLPMIQTGGHDPMTATPVQPEYLSRGIDYLGDLGVKLRDLQGFATLAHELIQNADDAPGATRMTFAVSRSALVVDNDGQFSDCGDVEEPECPWRHDVTRGYMCDFHGFRSVA